MAIENTDLFVLQKSGGGLSKTTFENLKDSVIGNSSTTQRITVTATGGQTVFDVTPAELVSGTEFVYLNGTLLAAGSDYSVTDTSEITLNTGAVVGDILEVISGGEITGERQYQNLGYNQDSVQGRVTITDGSDAVISAASATNAGLLTAANWTKLEGIAAGAQSNVKSDWNATSGDAEILNKPAIPTATSDLTNDSGFITSADIPSPVVPGDGTLIIKNSDGSEAGRFTANQPTGDEITIDLPEVFSGDYNDLDNIPVALRVAISATAGQTVFNTPTLTLVSGTEFVYLNGTLLSSGSDYSVTSSTQITLNTAAVEDDIVEIISGGEITGERQYQNLGYNQSTTQGVVTISDGTNATIPAADSSRAGLLTASNSNKLDGIQAGAEVNVQSDWNAGPNSDAYIIDKPATVVESITAGAGVSITNGGVGAVTISSTVDQLEFGGSADVTSSTVPSTTFNAVPLAIADFYVNVGFGKFSAQWAAVTDNATTDTDADPGDYLVYNGSTFEHIPSGTPPSADPNWIAAGGTLEPVNKNNQVVIGNSTTDVSLDVKGRAESASTASGNGPKTLTTKDYVDGLIPTVGAGTLTIKNYNNTNAVVFSANQSDTDDKEITLPKGFSGDYADLNGGGLNDVLNKGNTGYRELTIKENNSADAGPGTQIYHNGVISDKYLLREPGSNNSGMYSEGDGILVLKTDDTNGIVITGNNVDGTVGVEKTLYLNTHKNYPYLGTDATGKIISKNVVIPDPVTPGLDDVLAEDNTASTDIVISSGSDSTTISPGSVKFSSGTSGIYQDVNNIQIKHNNAVDAGTNGFGNVTTTFFDNSVVFNTRVYARHNLGAGGYYWFPDSQPNLNPPLLTGWSWRGDGHIAYESNGNYNVDFKSDRVEFNVPIYDQNGALITASGSVGNKTYNAIDWGCDPTGMEDCSENIEAILQDIKTRFENTKGLTVVDDTSEIYFPPGEYKLANPVVFTFVEGANDFNRGPKFTFKGAGQDLTRFIVANSTGGFNITTERHEGFVGFIGLAVVTKPANKSTPQTLWDPEYGIYLRCMDEDFSTQDRMAIIEDVRLGWDEERGGDWENGNGNANGYMKKGLTLINFYIPIIKNLTMCSRKRTDDQNSYPLKDNDSWGICVDYCYGGVIESCNLNVNHHAFGIKDTYSDLRKLNGELLEPKGEGGHISNCNIQARVGFARARFGMKPHLSMYSNHFNTAECCIDILNVSEFIINDTVIINDQFGTQNKGFRIRGCARGFIDQVTYSYGQDRDYSDNRMFEIQGSPDATPIVGEQSRQIQISNYTTYHHPGLREKGWAPRYVGWVSMGGKGVAENGGVEVLENKSFERFWEGKNDKKDYPDYWLDNTKVVNGNTNYNGFIISRPTAIAPSEANVDLEQTVSEQSTLIQNLISRIETLEANNTSIY